MIPVTKPYLPDREKLARYIDGIYERGWLTNNGPLVQKLTSRLEEYLGVKNLLLVSNGTLALQIAYRALGISGTQQKAEAITTPFTFVATASSLKWEGIEPIFADIDADTWCLDPANIEGAITPQTKAIVPVHVFGSACNVEAIEQIAKKHNLKIVYDASHAFGVKYKSESLLKHGDAATLSFHATKLFHTIEGGAIIFKRKESLERAKKMINFGLTGSEAIDALGINAKMNEFQAAMGLCVLDEIQVNLQARSDIWNTYEQALSNKFQLQARPKELEQNYSYFPVALKNKDSTKLTLEKLKEKNIQARRYFYPSLETTEFFQNRNNQTVSRSIAERILCLPLHHQINKEDQDLIIELLYS